MRAFLKCAEGDLLDALEDLPFVEGEIVNKSSFGQYLKRNVGRPVGGYRLEKVLNSERNAWRVVALAAVTPLPALPPASGPALGGRGFD